VTKDSGASGDDNVLRSLVPARMDRLPWSSFHWRMIIALGITWVLDGVEIGLASEIGNVLRERDTLHLTAETVGFSATLYLIGQVVGALYFGRQADRLGRRRLFIVTLALYLVANGLTALSFEKYFFLATRFAAGLGIGGEYAAIHSAVDELTPAKYRGRVDIAVAGTYWGGAILASAAQALLLNPDLIPIDRGWRISLLLGPAIGLAIWPLRKYIPESPRWQLAHGQVEEAEKTVTQIEDQLRAKGVQIPEVDPTHVVIIRKKDDVSYFAMIGILTRKYLRRSILGATLMMTQSFLYNAIFFTYAMILNDLYGVKDVAPYGLAFAVGNLAGPLILGRFFDTIGRRKMIFATYGASAVLLAVNGWMLSNGSLTAHSQLLLWCTMFFIASAGASSAYLTVSESFPVEIRAQAIAIFFALGQGFGAIGPFLFGLILSGGVDEKTQTITNVNPLAIAYALSAGALLLGGLVAWFLGIDAEGKSLEAIAPPISATTNPQEAVG
jgi:MFS family permease